MSKVNKCRIVKKYGDCCFIMQGIKGQSLNDREVFTMNGSGMEGILPVVVNKKGASFELVYHLNGLITLKEYLLNPLNRASFGRLLQNVLEVFQGIQTNFFSQECMLLESDRVFINTATQKLQYIYIPIQGYNGGGNLRNFLLDIIKAGSFDTTEDVGYVAEYIRILNNGLNFSVFELEEYVRELTADQGHTLRKNICPKCSTNAEPGANFCRVCGSKLVKEIKEEKQEITYNPLKELKPKQQETKKSEPTGKSRAALNAETQGLSSRVSQEYYGGTVLLGEYGYMYEPQGYLLRESTGEKVQMIKDSFRVGKSEKKCDYAVKDNLMVSRIHADIIRENGRYYIEDLKSTNGTYVENGMVSGKQEIFSGSRIRLANENFVFYIDR